MTELSSAVHGSDCIGCGVDRCESAQEVDRHGLWSTGEAPQLMKKQDVMMEMQNERRVFSQDTLNSKGQKTNPNQAKQNKQFIRRAQKQLKGPSQDLQPFWSVMDQNPNVVPSPVLSLSYVPLKLPSLLIEMDILCPVGKNGLQQLSKSHPERSAARDVSSSLNFSCKDPVEGFRQFIWDSDAWTTGPYCSQDVGYLLTQRGSQTLLGVGVSSFCSGCWLSTDTTTGAFVCVGRPLQCTLTVTTLVIPSTPWRRMAGQLP